MLLFFSIWGSVVGLFIFSKSQSGRSGVNSELYKGRSSNFDVIDILVKIVCCLHRIYVFIC